MRFSRFATAFMVDDPAACRDFFVTHLGATVLVDLGWYVDIGHPSDPSFTIDFVHRDHAAMPDQVRTATTGTVLALVVDDAHDLESRLAAAGVEIIAECRDEPWGQRHFFIATPGPVVEFVQQIPPDQSWLAANGL
ncbi:VOC family protein [Actinokineospora globicatena]|uniref:VOC family protein n=1 Tax=Actinokineospora globicatena TaxID=103729 RepID=UPI0020A26952|nr:VOC family protein [Actinokineospora globicatena]MCP2305419.1 Glyoxalase-like domain-containing protein [Actinokineospora globicatena]GLW81285.1 glyoxalase [Actinokineospora globicatena]GLW88017.1 glyoxalase [Actinokineospora globicatena]